MVGRHEPNLALPLFLDALEAPVKGHHLGNRPTFQESSLGPVATAEEVAGSGIRFLLERGDSAQECPRLSEVGLMVGGARISWPAAAVAAAVAVAVAPAVVTAGPAVVAAGPAVVAAAEEVAGSGICCLQE